MHVASNKLSEKLYKLSGWDSGIVLQEKPYIPAYSLGYLIRQLPVVELERHKDGENLYKCFSYGMYLEGVDKHEVLLEIGYKTPEDALAAMAVNLFEKGYLKK